MPFRNWGQSRLFKYLQEKPRSEPSYIGISKPFTLGLSKTLSTDFRVRINLIRVKNASTLTA
jgi:hypothetical protein